MPFCPQDEATGRTLPGAPVSHYSMNTMDTTSHARHDKDRNPLESRFSARAEFKIKFQDFAVLNSLATRFSAMQNV
jgi:predicted secreted protein